MIENFALLLGRHIRIRGSGRLLQLLYPCRADSKRFICGLRTRVDGLKFEADTRQLIDWCMQFHGEYEPHMRQLFQRLLVPGAIAADVGANVGAHTLTLAKLVGPAGHVLAFEPNPVVRDRLVRNLEINEFGNTATYGCALGETNGSLSLRVPATSSAEFANPGLASLVALETPHDLVDVHVRPFDEVFSETGLNRLDLVKIDVQGFEMAVLSGMRGVIAEFSPAIVFEYEDWAWHKADSTLQTAFDFFQSLSYSLWRIESGGMLKMRPIDATQVKDTHVELVAMRDGDHRIAAAGQRMSLEFSRNG